MDINVNRIIDYLNEPDPHVELYFTEKLRNKTYQSFTPNVDPILFNDLLQLIKDYLLIYKDYDLAKFDPTGLKAETLEYCNTDYVGNFMEVMKSFSDGDQVDTSIDPDDLTFYAIKIFAENIPNIYFFRRVRKFKKLNAKGIIAQFNGHTLNRIENKLLGIDGEIDFVVIDDEILIFSHHSLERIFNLDEKFTDYATEFLSQPELQRGIENYDLFCSDALNDGRYRRILSKMNNEDINLQLTFQNHSNIIKTLDMFELDIDYEQTPHFKICYKEKSELMDILRILRDSYYQSLINQNIGVDDN